MRSESSQRNRVETAIREYSSTIAGQRLTLRGISAEVIRPLVVDKQDTATKESRAALIFWALFMVVCVDGDFLLWHECGY